VPHYTLLNITFHAVCNIPFLKVKVLHSFEDQTAQQKRLLSPKRKNRFWTAEMRNQ